MNSFSLLQALVFEPKKVFAELGVRPRVLFPLVLLVVSGAGVLFWYFSVVDMAWLIESQMNNAGSAQMTEEQLKATRTVGPAILKWGGLIGAIVSIVAIRLIEALYYLLAGKITNVQRSFKQWLSLSAWSSLPSVLGVIPAAIVLLTATSTQIDQGELQTLSLNNLLFHRTAADPGYSLLISINLLQIVGLYLAALGVRVWSGRSWLFSVVFTLLPWALILGVWALFAMGRA
jgi:hypothetical protein